LVLSHYYTDDRGDNCMTRGGRVVGDHQLDRAACSTEVKNSAEFNQLIQSVRREGFNPKVRQHVDAFNLMHPDSFQTLLNVESTTPESA